MVEQLPFVSNSFLFSFRSILQESNLDYKRLYEAERQDTQELRAQIDRAQQELRELRAQVEGARRLPSQQQQQKQQQQNSQQHHCNDADQRVSKAILFWTVSLANARSAFFFPTI